MKPMKLGEIRYFYPGWCHDCQLNFTSPVPAPYPCKYCGGRNTVGAQKKPHVRLSRGA
jgi:hypothetical protein